MCMLSSVQICHSSFPFIIFIFFTLSYSSIPQQYIPPPEFLCLSFSLMILVSSLEYFFLITSPLSSSPSHYLHLVILLYPNILPLFLLLPVLHFFHFHFQFSHSSFPFSILAVSPLDIISISFFHYLSPKRNLSHSPIFFTQSTHFVRLIFPIHAPLLIPNFLFLEIFPRISSFTKMTFRLFLRNYW